MTRIFFRASKRRSTLWGCLALGMVLLFAVRELSGEKSSKEVDWGMLLPDGPGKELVMSLCVGCHSLEHVVLRQKSKDGWLGSVGFMIGEYNAQVPEEDVEGLVDYLARAAGEDNPVTEIPMDVNVASAEALKRLRFVTGPEIEAILQQRSKNKFKSLEEVRALLKLSEDRYDLFQTYLKVR